MYSIAVARPYYVQISAMVICIILMADVFYDPQTKIILKKVEIQIQFIYLCYNAGKTDFPFIVNKSSKSNISEFVIVLFYCIAIIIIAININELKAFI